MPIQSKSHLVPKVEKLIQGGLTVAQACKKAGLSVPSLYNYRNKKPGKASKAKRSVRIKGEKLSAGKDVGGALLVFSPKQARKIF